MQLIQHIWYNNTYQDNKERAAKFALVNNPLPNEGGHEILTFLKVLAITTLAFACLSVFILLLSALAGYILWFGDGSGL